MATKEVVQEVLKEEVLQVVQVALKEAVLEAEALHPEWT